MYIPLSPNKGVTASPNRIYVVQVAVETIFNNETYIKETTYNK